MTHKSDIKEIRNMKDIRGTAAKKDIAIVIPNYNGNKYLKQCLDSVYTQDYKGYEVIIIDNASTDGSYEWVKEYKDVVFKRLDKNYGFSRAVNEGIKMANTEYVLLLNNDTELFTDFLSKMKKAIINDSRIFSVSSKMIQYHDKAYIDDAGDEYTVLGWAYKRGDGSPIETFNQCERIFSTCAGAALYRKAVFEEIGYFDESFFAYMEDVDVSYRGNIYGYKNVYMPEAKVYHIGSATSGSKYNAFKVKLAARNNLYVPYKNMPLLQLIINMPFLLLGIVIKAVWFTKLGFGKEYARGLWDGLTHLNNVKKVPFKMKHLVHYIYIEWLLIKNTVQYIADKIKKIQKRVQKNG